MEGVITDTGLVWKACSYVSTLGAGGSPYPNIVCCILPFTVDWPQWETLVWNSSVLGEHCLPRRWCEVCEIIRNGSDLWKDCVIVTHTHHTCVSPYVRVYMHACIYIFPLCAYICVYAWIWIQLFLPLAMGK